MGYLLLGVHHERAQWTWLAASYLMRYFRRGVLGEAQGVDIAWRLERRQCPQLDIVLRQCPSAFRHTQRGVLVLDA